MASAEICFISPPPYFQAFCWKHVVVWKDSQCAFTSGIGTFTCFWACEIGFGAIKPFVVWPAQGFSIGSQPGHVRHVRGSSQYSSGDCQWITYYHFFLLCSVWEDMVRARCDFVVFMLVIAQQCLQWDGPKRGLSFVGKSLWWGRVSKLCFLVPIFIGNAVEGMIALINGFNLALENGHALCTVVWLNNSALCGALGLGKQQQT